MMATDAAAPAAAHARASGHAASPSPSLAETSARSMHSDAP